MMLPELLAPAGNLEKLKMSILYGADAVYLGGLSFGLRAASDNFTQEELRQGTAFAQSLNRKIFVTLNSFFHQEDFEKLPDFLGFLEKIKIDAVIVSDLGVVKAVKNLTNIPVHLSTQASCNNSEAAKFWGDQGVERIVLGREVSLYEARSIKEKSGLEVEMFVHGSMCMSYSGNCVISNYTQGRDSNRGGCAHSCRFEYKLFNDQKEQNAFFMSSKDLNGLMVLDQFIENGIDSLKIEGRMKSYHYAGSISKVYREALDYYKDNGKLEKEFLETLYRESEKVSHRAYSESNLIFPAGPDTIYDEREHENNQAQVVGRILEVDDRFIFLEVRAGFSKNDRLEIVPFKGSSFPRSIDRITNLFDEDIENTRPGTVVKIPRVENCEVYNLVRGYS